MCPGGPRDITDSVPFDLSVLPHHVSFRMLYQHTARANLGMRSHVERMAKYGGDVRTTSAPFERMLIIDRTIAFIPIGAPGDEVPGAAVVTSPALVRFLYRSFGHAWASALPCEYGHAHNDEVSVDTKVALLRLMASGLKDEAIATRLGMAPRTCRRHMSAIMAELDVSSRFQAGVKIANMGILSAQDTMPVQRRRTDAHPVW